MSRLDRLLGYVSFHPNACKIYRASDTILRVHSDASYLSRPRAGSVAGSLTTWGARRIFSSSTPRPRQSPRLCPLHSYPCGCILCHRGRNRRRLCRCPHASPSTRDKSSILADLGHPQPPTVIYGNNECAIGLVPGHALQLAPRSRESGPVSHRVRPWSPQIGRFFH